MSVARVTEIIAASPKSFDVPVWCRLFPTFSLHHCARALLQQLRPGQASGRMFVVVRHDPIGILARVNGNRDVIEEMSGHLIEPRKCHVTVLRLGWGWHGGSFSRVSLVDRRY